MIADVTVESTDTAAILAGIVDQLAELRTRPDMTGPQAHAALQQILLIRNLADHHAAAFTGELDRLGVADGHGRRLRELLVVMGCAPAVAARFVRIGTATDIDPLRRHAADGSISSEHADAIVRGLSHIETRSVEPVEPEMRLAQLMSLMSWSSAGMTPAQITDHARTIANELAADTDDGKPAAEDKAINELGYHKTDDGRLDVRANLDAVAGEKLHSLVESLSAPKPQPDGSHDPRSADRKRADALETILELAEKGLADETVSCKPTGGVLLTIPADAPKLSALEFMGSVTPATAKTLGCDAAVTVVIVDGEQVPLNVGREKRLFTPSQRKALLLRDKCCVKCGAPASRTQAHHLVSWADGGATDLDNGCLLCTACHHDVHDRAGAGSEASGPNDHWDVVMGFDRHPWLIPPATIDPKRRPLPAYNRRTLRLDNAA
ncbi:DUF222 domain-containing protein [Gordonia sp. DT219]|uniref:HNH endonuclease n=1 Tax=Gordonia sp. DT219 TaxID=3416658 RepID=UPI003CF7F2E2